MSTRRPAECEWQACQDIARAHGRSFFLASRMLGRESRRAILAAYAYCRLADDIVDQSDGDPSETETQLRGWEAQLAEPSHPVAVAFSAVRERYHIPERPIREFFEGLHADLTVDRYPSWVDLRVYCHQVAGTVGLIVAPILGCRDESALPRAAELGIAMQLTNILRDVGEDANMGRIYLPLDELERFGIDPKALRMGEPGPGFPDLMRFQIARARTLYQRALTGTPSLSASGRLTTLLAAELYSGILDQIETNQFDVFSQRAVLTRSRKTRRSASAACRFLSISGVAGGWYGGPLGRPSGSSPLPNEPDPERALW